MKKIFILFLISLSFHQKINGQATLSFLSNDTTVLETSGSTNIYVKLTSTSPASCAITISPSLLSNASATDYTLSTVQVTFAAGAPVNSSAPVNILLNNDVTIESVEYIVLRLVNGVNAVAGATSQSTFYIKDDDKPVPSAINTLSLNLLSSFSNSITGANSAEIVAHDQGSQRLYIANSIGAKLDIVNFINPSSPSLLSSISVTPYGNINSVAVFNGTVACAIENGTNPQDSGKVVFFDKNGVFLKQVKVGMMPDMITFNHSGTRVLTANEGEPNASYTLDPDGSVSIIDISGGLGTLTQTNVTHVTFTSYNGQENTLRAQGIRIYGPGASTSMDFEPEYIAISPDDSRAYVTLQENNAFAEINLTNNSIIALRALGSKDHNLLVNGLDASNLTKGVNIANFPVKGLYLPDAVACYTVAGVPYLITANEGDSRAYSGYSEEFRVSSGSIVLDPTIYPNSSEIKNNYFLGRLNVTRALGDNNNDGDLDTLFCYGSRSFSIWNALTGVQIYDSKDDLEQITAVSSFSNMFNASNSIGVPVKKDRSDDKGPEPEGVAIGKIGTNTYAFIALERIGGVMVYDVTSPSTPSFVTYVNNVNPLTGTPDRGAEGIIFIPQSKSPNGQHIVIAANEISSSLSIWGIPGCLTPLASSLSVNGSTLACSNSGPTMMVPVTSGATYQWHNNGSQVPGAIFNSHTALSSGTYSCVITGTGGNCVTQSMPQSVSLTPTPTIMINGGSGTICLGESATLTATGASGTYSWSTGSISNSIIVSPTLTSSYIVIGTNTNSCSSSQSYQLLVSPCTKVDEESFEEKITIYPNPTHELLNICTGSFEKSVLRIFDTNGKMVYYDPEHLDEEKIQVVSFVPGVYLVLLQNDNSSTTRKVIVK